jgi:putative lipoprotein (rSAM/lipoprotein system)
MKKQVIKNFDKIILAILGLSGIVYSCAKYGMIVPESEIKGTITDKITAKPIQGIRVVRENFAHNNDTVYTNSEGQYAFEFAQEGRHLEVEDIDGEANGGDFESQKIYVKLTESDLVKRSKSNKKPDRYVKVQNVELTRKDEPIPLYGVQQAPFKP